MLGANDMGMLALWTVRMLALWTVNGSYILNYLCLFPQPIDTKQNSPFYRSKLYCISLVNCLKEFYLAR